MLLVQALIDHYQKNSLEKIFPEVKTSLQIPYKNASKSWLLPFLLPYYAVAISLTISVFTGN